MQFLSDIAPNLIATAIGLIVGGVLVYFFFPRAKEEYLDEEGTHKRKILELIDARGMVSHSDVEKYLAVSPEEAEKELSELARRGVIRETRKPGMSEVFYEAATHKKRQLQ